MEAMLYSDTRDCAFASLFSTGDKNPTRWRCRLVGVSTNFERDYQPSLLTPGLLFPTFAPSQSGNMVKLNILAGGNIAFIASYLFDSDNKTLALVRQNPSGENPSWIERSVVNSSIL